VTRTTQNKLYPIRILGYFYTLHLKQGRCFDHETAPSAVKMLREKQRGCAGESGKMVQRAISGSPLAGNKPEN
jgi:hypothetical protein